MCLSACVCVRGRQVCSGMRPPHTSREINSGSVPGTSTVERSTHFGDNQPQPPTPSSVPPVGRAMTKKRQPHVFLFQTHVVKLLWPLASMDLYYFPLAVALGPVHLPHPNHSDIVVFLFMLVAHSRADPSGGIWTTQQQQKMILS